MLDSEEKIVTSAVGGDPLAFGALYDNYQPQIYRFVYLKVSGKEDAEDLTHQVFLNAWLGIGKYKHRGFPFSSWLYQIARNQVVDYYRSKRDTSPIETADIEGVVENPKTGVIDEGLELEKVTDAIRRLKAEYQDVLILRFVEDMAVKDVAKLLDKSEGAVKLLQHRAIKVLKEMLQEKLDIDVDDVKELEIGDLSDGSLEISN